MFCAIIYILLMTGSSIFSVRAASMNMDDMESDEARIKYPGPTKDVDMSRYDEDEHIPESCRGQTFCTIKPKNYPEEKYNEIFKHLKPALSTPHLVPIDELANRQGDPNDKDDCDSEVKYEPLYSIRSKRDNTWKSVIQVPKNGFLQNVRLEICRDTTSSCFKVFSDIPGYTTHCKQSLSTWTFLIDDGNNGTIEETVPLPTCCKCAYRIDLENRFGKPMSKPKGNKGHH